MRERVGSVPIRLYSQNQEVGFTRPWGRSVPAPDVSVPLGKVKAEHGYRHQDALGVYTTTEMAL